MNIDKTKSETTVKKIGRPKQEEVQKKATEISIEGEWILVKIHRKSLTKMLLSQLI